MVAFAEGDIVSSKAAPVGSKLVSSQQPGDAGYSVTALQVFLPLNLRVVTTLLQILLAPVVMTSLRF